jgi:hypothetical protein
MCGPVLGLWLPSRRDCLVWPCPCPYALIERVGGEARPAGPHDGSCLRIDGHLRKPVGCESLLEHPAAHSIEHVDLADQAVGERQAQDAVAYDSDGGDMPV